MTLSPSKIEYFQLGELRVVRWLCVWAKIRVVLWLRSINFTFYCRIRDSADQRDFLSQSYVYFFGSLFYLNFAWLIDEAKNGTTSLLSIMLLLALAFEPFSSNAVVVIIWKADNIVFDRQQNFSNNFNALWKSICKKAGKFIRISFSHLTTLCVSLGSEVFSNASCFLTFFFKKTHFLQHGFFLLQRM